MFPKLLFLALLLAGAPSAMAEISVTNHQDESTVRYPVILLRGTMDPASSKLVVRVSGAEAESTVVRHEGRFKALVELEPGRNIVTLKSEAEERSLAIRYQTQSTPYYVRVIWMTDSEGDTGFATPSEDVPQDYVARMRTAAQLMQTFTAERMKDLGLGHRTFRLERDSEGEIVVHTLKAPKTAEYYYGMETALGGLRPLVGSIGVMGIASPRTWCWRRLPGRIQQPGR